MAAITLYNFELDDRCYRVRLLLSMLGVEHRVVAVNMAPGAEEKTAPFLALNPLGGLPILTDGASTIYGAEAILAYLAKAHDASKSWLPDEPASFGSVMQWLNFSASELCHASEARRISLFGGDGVPDALKLRCRRAFRIMDDTMTLRHIDGAEWFSAGHATLADLALFPMFALSRDFGIDHDEFPALRRWMRRFRSLPGFRTMPGIPDYH